MNVRRLVLYVALLVALAAIGFGLTLWALGACAPPPLPGDEAWTFRQNLSTALSLIQRTGSADCYTGNGTAMAALWLGARTGWVLVGFLLLVAFLETAGRQLRLAWFRAVGGHTLLIGRLEAVESLASSHTGGRPVAFLAPDRRAAADIARAHPLAEVATLAIERIAAQLSSLGAPRAALLATALPTDFDNLAVVEAALARGGIGELLARIEEPSVRTLEVPVLRTRAAAFGWRFLPASLANLQARIGLSAAMSNRYTVDDNERVHIVVCGAGTGMQELTAEIVRQGFGLEHHRRRISILRTGGNDFAPGVLEQWQELGLAEFDIVTAYAGDLNGLSRAIDRIAQQWNTPLLAVHCLGETPAEADALALRWEVQLANGHVPPIIAYGASRRAGGFTGMVRSAAPPTMAEAHAMAARRERLGRAVHERYLDAQRPLRGDKFGTYPSEKPWDELDERYRESNRGVADQMEEVKLARVRLVAERGEDSVTFTAGEIEVLAQVAHARWIAEREIAGWRHGPVRDDKAMTHPDLVPYEQLDEPARQKDRDEVATLPVMSRLEGKMLKRERCVAVATPLTPAAIGELVRALAATTPKTAAPVGVICLDSPAMIGMAEALLGNGIRIEAVLNDGVAALRFDPLAGQRLADVLRAAWRIHVVRSGDARGALGKEAREVADETGAIHALD